MLCRYELPRFRLWIWKLIKKTNSFVVKDQRSCEGRPLGSTLWTADEGYNSLLNLKMPDQIARSSSSTSALTGIMLCVRKSHDIPGSHRPTYRHRWNTLILIWSRSSNSPIIWYVLIPWQLHLLPRRSSVGETHANTQRWRTSCWSLLMRCQSSGHHSPPYISRKLWSCHCQFCLQLCYSSLKDWDGSDAPIYRIFHTRIRLVGNRIHGVLSLMLGQLIEKLGNVASSEDLVNVCEFLGLVGWKVRCENALGGALSTKEFASCTRRSRRRCHDQERGWKEDEQQYLFVFKLLQAKSLAGSYIYSESEVWFRSMNCAGLGKDVGVELRQEFYGGNWAGEGPIKAWEEMKKSKWWWWWFDDRGAEGR